MSYIGRAFKNSKDEYALIIKDDGKSSMLSAIELKPCPDYRINRTDYFHYLNIEKAEKRNIDPEYKEVPAGEFEKLYSEARMQMDKELTDTLVETRHEKEKKMQKERE